MSADQTTPTIARSIDGSIAVAVYNETGPALPALRSAADPSSTQTEADWASIAVQVLAGEGVTGGNLEIFFVDEQRMVELNAEHMGKQGATDVLAFPLDGVDELVSPLDDAALDVSTGMAEVERHLGDVVICAQIAGAQALDHAGSFDAEITLLVIHGVLHVLGHDHYEPAEAETMRSKERQYLTARGFQHPGAQDESDPSC